MTINSEEGASLWTGDINGNCKVNIIDLILVAGSIPSTPSSPDWNPAADLNEDARMTILDLILMAT